MDEYITDPGLIAALEAAEQGLQKFNNTPLQAAPQAPSQPQSVPAQMPGQGQRSLADVQQQFSRTGELPRDNPQQGPSIGSQMLGGAMQGAAAFAPMLANKVPMAAQWLAKLAQSGRGGAMAASAIPQAAEAGLAYGGSRLQGQDQATAGMAAAQGPAMRGVMGAGKMLGRSIGNTMFPDQMREAANIALEKKFGPAIVSRDLYNNFVNPNMSSPSGSQNTLGAISSFKAPNAFTRSQAGPVSDFWNLAQKYTNNSRHTVGEMWDDIHTLNGTKAVAKRSGMGYFAQQIEQVQKSMYDDIGQQIPQLKLANEAFAKEMRLNDLAGMIKSSTPLDDWNMESKTKLMQNAFPRASDREEIRNIMSMVARQGGGSHYFGKLAGMGIGGLFGTGAGLASGAGPISTAMMGTAGMLLPEALGHMLANPGGRAFLSGLIKRNPTGWTPTATNAALQWYNIYRQTGTADRPEAGK